MDGKNREENSRFDLYSTFGIKVSRNPYRVTFEDIEWVASAGGLARRLGDSEGLAFEVIHWDEGRQVSYSFD